MHFFDDIALKWTISFVLGQCRQRFARFFDDDVLKQQIMNKGKYVIS